MQRLSSAIPKASLMQRPTALRTFAATPKFGPKLDEHGEPRFLEQVKLFFNEAASKTGIDEQYLNLIKAC